MAAPIGNQNAARAKVWKAAIERALEVRGAGDRLAALNALAEKLLAKAEEGDMSALKELGDRLDGKSVQPVAGDADGPPVALEIGWRKHSS
jgi:hypothetical protein